MDYEEENFPIPACDSRLGDFLCNLPQGHSESHRDGCARWIGSMILLD